MADADLEDVVEALAKIANIVEEPNTSAPDSVKQILIDIRDYVSIISDRLDEISSQLGSLAKSSGRTPNSEGADTIT